MQDRFKFEESLGRNIVPDGQHVIYIKARIVEWDGASKNYEETLSYASVVIAFGSKDTRIIRESCHRNDHRCRLENVKNTHHKHDAVVWPNELLLPI